MKAVKATELFIDTDNKVGVLMNIANLVSSANINIRAISAWAFDTKAFFRLITSNTQATRDILRENKYSFEEKEVVVVELPDRIGELTNLSTKLKEAGVDLIYTYGTTSKPEGEAIIVLSSNNNDKALEVINAEYRSQESEVRSQE